MALASKSYTRMYSTTGSDSDKIDSRDVTKMESQFTNNEYIQDLEKFEQQGMLIVQVQKLMDELDEIRRHLRNDVTGMTELNGSSLPTTRTGLSRGTLWNDRGTVKVV